MQLTLPALLASVLLFSGCSLLPRQRAIPSERTPHRVAEETTVSIYVRLPDESFIIEEVRLPVGWWIAAPSVVE